jgi:hypothetical protein
LTAIAAAVALSSFKIIGEVTRRIETSSVPGMSYAFDLVRHSADLAGLTSAIMAADTSAALSTAESRFQSNQQLMKAALYKLAGSKLNSDRIEALTTEANGLAEMVAGLAAAVKRRVVLASDRDQLMQSVVAAHRAMSQHAVLTVEAAAEQAVLSTGQSGNNLASNNLAPNNLAPSKLPRKTQPRNIQPGGAAGQPSAVTQSAGRLEAMAKLRAESNVLLSLVMGISLAATVDDLPALSDQISASQVRVQRALEALGAPNLPSADAGKGWAMQGI